MITSTHGTVHTVVEAVTGASATLFVVPMVRAVPVTEAWDRSSGHAPWSWALPETDAPGSRKLTPGSRECTLAPRRPDTEALSATLRSTLPALCTVYERWTVPAPARSAVPLYEAWTSVTV